jgi:Ca2+/Na+ antiporter
MDEDVKKEFKWKFYYLTIELNIIVLLVAMTIPIFLIIHSPLTIPVIVMMLAAALAVSVDFVRRYHETKAWLDNNADQEKESKTETGS